MISRHDPLKNLNHLQRYLVEEYVEDYQEGAMSRRQALKHIGAVMGSLVLANTVLAGCVPPPAQPAQATPIPAQAPATPTPAQVAATPTPAEVAATATREVLATTATEATATPLPVPSGVSVPADDPQIEASDVTLPGDGLELLGYQAKLKGAEPRPGILVAHENRGLTDYIKDVTRRLAKAGYVALAVDQLSSVGGTGAVTDPAQIPATLSATSPDELASFYLSGLEYLKGLPDVQGDRLGMVGFCFGGGMTWLVATKAPELKAAVPFYGPNPPLEGVANIGAAVLAVYGGDDERINAGIPAVEEAMSKNNKVFEKVIYPGAGHAFHNDTGARYNAQAAVDAWARTLAWFEKYV